MPNESRPLDRQQPLELIPDYPYESRYEFVSKIGVQALGTKGAPPRLTGGRLVGSGTSCVRVVSSVGDDYPILE